MRLIVTQINGNIQGINSNLIRGNGYTALEVLNDNGTIYRMQLSANGGLVHLYENSGSGWYRTDSLALKSDLTGVLKYNGTFSGDFNNIDISPGIYKINTKYTNAPSQLPVYCVFIQFPVYNLQMIITGDQMFTRKYTGNPAYWTPWRWYNFDGND